MIDEEYLLIVDDVVVGTFLSCQIAELRAKKYIGNCSEIKVVRGKEDPRYFHAEKGQLMYYYKNPNICNNESE